jgi:hypothetical protein
MACDRWGLLDRRYELAVDEPVKLRIAIAIDQLAAVV